MNRYIYILVLLCFGGAAIAQPTMKQYLKEADSAYASGNFFSALVNYGEALKSNKNDASLWYKYGNAALKQNAFKQSEKAFSMVVDSLQSNAYPDAIYKLAESKAMLGKYDEASTYYTLYTSEYNDVDAMTTKAARNGMKSVEWAKQQSKENDAYSIEKLGGNVNTSFSEHGPALLDDELYFASLRFNGVDNKECGFSKVMKNRDVANTALKSKTDFNTDGRLTNSPSFSPDGTMLYYSLCDYTPSGSIVCDLYAAKVDGDKVGNGVKLGAAVNGDGYTSTHPSVSADGTLYFASDKPGGKGGLDIYKATIGSDMSISGVMGVDAVNTAGDDLTPFISGNGDLYFSSNGRLGFGGYDVYVLQGGEVSNLGAEVNTSLNDLYFILNSENSMGYLASNRPGSMYADDAYETCCYDIYKVLVESCTVQMMALVTDCADNKDLNGATVTVTNNATGEVVFSETYDARNKFKPEFDCDNAYTVTATKPGYTIASVNVGPYAGKRGIQKLEETLCLAIAKLNVELFSDNCKAPASGSVTLYNVTTGTQETKAADNKTSFDIVANNKYKMVTTKGGFVTDVQEFNTNGMTSAISKKVCFEKSLTASCSSMVPVRLYFDNDYPNPKSRATTTTQSYSELYNDYYNKKSEFIRKFGGNYGGKVRESVEGEVGSFFENDLANGYNSLNRFLDCILEVLKSGQTANLFLRGYASPLAKDDYNVALTQRRVESVKNEIRRFKGGILTQYLDNGQLKVTERAFGETVAPTGISDSPSDRRKSHYSPEASRERRVEIDEIKFNN